MDDNKLATELLHELKASAERWFIIAVLELIAIVVLIVVFFIVPVEETSTSIEQEAHATDNTQLIGGDYYGTASSQNDVQETQNDR